MVHFFAHLFHDGGLVKVARRLRLVSRLAGEELVVAGHLGQVGAPQTALVVPPTLLSARSGLLSLSYEASTIVNLQEQSSEIAFASTHALPLWESQMIEHHLT